MMLTHPFDLDSYKESMNKISKLTPLFSDGKTAYIPYRFVERLYAKCANGINIAQSNAVFDTVLTSNVGVGVKTFVMGARAKSKFEKVQEFTKRAGATKLNSFNKAKIMEELSIYRNASIKSDCEEYGVTQRNSIYHCFIRKPGLGLILEESYEEIDISALTPCDKDGKTLGGFVEDSREFFFTDKKNVYSYSKSKSVLYKKFQLDGENVKAKFNLDFQPEIWSQYYSGISLANQNLKILEEELEENQGLEEEEVVATSLVPGVDYVVLPLYGIRTKQKFVELKSGLNQWNAKGRTRNFGEAYIPVPKKVRVSCLGFFPPRKTPFSLVVPGNSTPLNVRICQDDGKALMSKPNRELCTWIYKIIDPNFSPSDIGKRIKASQKPYTYKDLVRVGKDCVIVNKDRVTGEYRISFGPLDGYEEFLETLLVP